MAFKMLLLCIVMYHIVPVSNNMCDLRDFIRISMLAVYPVLILLNA